MENKCPSCHSTNIRNDSIRNNNGIIGPGCRSWVVEEKYSCNDCGVYFKPVAEKPAAVKQIDREWLCGILIDFTIAYVKSTNKDIANDAAEYLDDKLKEVSIVYVLSEDEQTAAGREEDIAEQDRKDGKELSAHYAHIEACEKNEAVAFVNWTLSSGCDTYTCTDEDQWTNIYTKENITTAALYDIFKQ